MTRRKALTIAVMVIGVFGLIFALIVAFQARTRPFLSQLHVEARLSLRQAHTDHGEANDDHHQEGHHYHGEADHDDRRSRRRPPTGDSATKAATTTTLGKTPASKAASHVVHEEQVILDQHERRGEDQEEECQDQARAWRLGGAAASPTPAAAEGLRATPAGRTGQGGGAQDASGAGGNNADGTPVNAIVIGPPHYYLSPVAIIFPACLRRQLRALPDEASARRHPSQDLERPAAGDLPHLRTGRSCPRHRPHARSSVGSSCLASGMACRRRASPWVSSRSSTSDGICATTWRW